MHSAALAVLALALLGCASATSPPTLSSCGVFPRPLPRPPMHPPALQDPCEFITCPPARGQCYEEPRCMYGQCMAPVPKTMGSACDDGDDSTSNDVCNGNGQCTGLALECPETLFFFDSESVVATWDEPMVDYLGQSFTVTRTGPRPGSTFAIGTHDISYVAVGSTLRGESIVLACAFQVVVNDNCRGVVCGRAGECEEEGVCVDGQCIYEPLADGETCGSGVCISGSCENPCAGVVCDGHMGGSCRARDQCVIEGIEGVCRAGDPIPDGRYPIGGNALAFDQRERSCFMGNDVCGAPLRHLPRRPPMLPPHPPSIADPCDFLDCPAPPNECYHEAVCADGFCMAHEPVRMGETCDDHDVNTLHDICSGTGRCIGFDFQCPADVRADVGDDGRTAVVNWDAPTIDYPGTDLHVTFSRSPGSRFNLGVTNVVYTVTGQTPNGQEIRSECTFSVEVADFCDGVSCSPDAECEVARCVGGQCLSEPGPDGQDCRLSRGGAGTCVAGQCVNLCAGITCENDDNVCRGPGYCVVENLQPTCSLGDPVLDGRYGTNERRTLPDFLGSFGDPYEVECLAGTDVCSGRNRHMPRPMPRAPPHPPAFFRTTTTSAPETTVIENTDGNVGLDICVGTKTLGSEEPCRCNNQCHTCEWSNGESGTCSKCKNAFYLLEGSCVESSECDPSRYDLIGQGNFGRRCVAKTEPTGPTTTTATTTTTTPNSNLQECSNGKLPDGSDCRCNAIQNCHTCSYQNGEAVDCTICKNKWYLLPNGQCVETCFQGMTPIGSGNFKRRCDGPMPATAAPPTDIPTGPELCSGGKTDRTGKPCSCRSLSNCHTCEHLASGETGVCTICKNAKYLLNGECVEPEVCSALGLRLTGSGLFKRECKSSVARRDSSIHARSAAAAPASAAVHPSSSSSTSWIASAIAFIALVALVAAVAMRRSSIVEDTLPISKQDKPLEPMASVRVDPGELA